jgi:hypothetical protein
MGSWVYAFAMQRPGERLDTVSALRVFNDGSFGLGESASEVAVDEAGHCDPAEVEHKLSTQCGWDEAARLLASEVDLHLEFRDANLFFAVTFATAAKSPHIAIGWSVRLFHGLSRDEQCRYWALIGKFSEAGRAGAVVLLRDAPDYFEDRILLSGTDVLVDALLPTGRRIEIYEIWAEGCVEVEGWNVAEQSQRIGSFRRYAMS